MTFRIILFIFLYCFANMSAFANTNSIETNRASDNKYEFSPQELQETSLFANHNVQQKFQGLTQDQLIQNALEYFQQQDTSINDQYVLVISKIPNEEAFRVYKKNGETYRINVSDLLEEYRLELVIHEIHRVLKEKHPNKILDQIQWAWNQAAGGPSARIGIIYCSLSEYIAFFGANNKIGGYSGSYSAMDVYDIMFSGQMTSFGSNSKDSFSRTYLAGDISVLERNSSRNYEIAPRSYMVDYGVGNIAAGILKGVIGPFFFVNFDSDSFTSQIKGCIQSMKQRMFNKD